MFSRVSNASKAAFLTLAIELFIKQTAWFIDCQVPTEHLLNLGGQIISRTEFLQMLQAARLG
jgi:leucyl/phenylalanyl-tRNA--protein transferase